MEVKIRIDTNDVLGNYTFGLNEPAFQKPFLRFSEVVYPFEQNYDLEAGYLYVNPQVAGRIDLHTDEVVVIGPGETHVVKENLKAVEICGKVYGDVSVEDVLTELDDLYVYPGQWIAIDDAVINILEGIGLVGPKTVCNLDYEQKSQDEIFEGVGGVDHVLAEITNRVLRPRSYTKETLERTGIKPPKGIILHGLPGTGKTLMARKIAQMFRTCLKPTITSGPALLNSRVGESEKMIRELFEPAFTNPKLLQVVIIDELDALCVKRSNDKAKNTDSMVNQLLSTMDGVLEVDNILVIGMTNRIEAIDPALMRAGRFEVILHVDLPDKEGREEILKIKLAPAIKAGACDVHFRQIAAKTAGYTGADIQALVNLVWSNYVKDPSKDKITTKHFDMATAAYKPRYAGRQNLPELIQGQNVDAKTLSTLLRNDKGLAVIQNKENTVIHYAHRCEDVYLRVVQPADLLHMSESEIIEELQSVFSAAEKVSSATIIILNFERLIRYHNHKFSAHIVNALAALVESATVPKTILSTSLTADVINDLGLRKGKYPTIAEFKKKIEEIEGKLAQALYDKGELEDYVKLLEDRLK